MSTALIIERREIIARYEENHPGDYLVGTGITLKKYGPKSVSAGNRTDEPRVGIRFFNSLGEGVQGPPVLPVEVIVTEDRLIGTRLIGDSKLRLSSEGDLRTLKRLNLLSKLPPDLSRLLEGLSLSV